MNIKKAYYYLFYRLYKVTKRGAIKSLSKFYAGIAIAALEFWLAMSVYNYYTVFINRYASLPKKSAIVVIVLIFMLIDYFAFIHNDKWKDYMAEFENWPKKKNIRGGIIAWGIIIFIIANLIFSFYLMSLINWKLYR